MGICASCLGLNRHPSQDRDLDRILDSDQPTYGTIHSDTGVVQPDEEELRREREALEHITAQATDHMIDVLHPSQADLNNNLTTSSNHIYASHASDDGRVDSAAEQHDVDVDAEEAAWLESIEAAGTADVQVPQKGALVMDIGLLRDGTTQHKTSKMESAY